jgi:DNA mismatch repair protein MutS2
MTEETYHNLEFDRILDIVSQSCTSEMGKLRLRNSRVFADAAALQQALIQVAESRSIIETDGGMPIWAFEDLRSLLNKIEPLESFLEPPECQQVQNFLEICGSVEKFFVKHGERYPELNRVAIRIDSLSVLFSLLQNTIDPSGAIYDNASPELKQIRKEISFISKQIHIRLERILKKSAEFLQESYVTVREGRLVLPVREFSVNKIPGIVHGKSGSGQTHYIEPMDVVQLNNEIHELYNRERNEIIRILKRIATNIRSHASEILVNFENLIYLDMIQARARYAQKVDATAPDINDEFAWDIRKGTHPLILHKLGADAVPLDLAIGAGFRELIITGPNAGGKTVALKSVGLLQLLFQSGFHIPVAEGSRFPLCNEIFAVIGDEQSIENDLSTFSSHINKLNRIVKSTANRLLVLIDEIGSGTDPQEGSALSIALLEYLNRPEMVTIVTTHHGELKAFAQNTPGVENGAMQYSSANLSPRFILDVGIPGSSYAFDISRRLGFSDEILDRAREILGGEHHELENIIIELSQTRQDYQDKINRISIKETELDGLKALYNTRAEDIRKRRKELENEARESARKILEDVNRTIETVVREIRESGAAKDVIKRSKDVVRGLKKKIGQPAAREAEPEFSIEMLGPGMRVRSSRFEVAGEIVRVNKDKKEIDMEARGLKITVPLSDIELLDHKVITKEETEPEAVVSKSVSYEIDLRGRTGEEAIMELERYLDLAQNSGWKEIRIIHGKGTGQLRQQIHAYLKRRKGVGPFRLGRYGEGDTGVTIIENS